MIKSFLSFVLSLLVLLFLSFALMVLAPGDPFADEIGSTPELLHAMRESYGLNASIPQQFCTYTLNMLHGDLGKSIRLSGEEVTSIIERSFPVSLQLGIQTFALSLPLGLLIGLLSAYQKRHALLSSIPLTIGISLPTFVVAALLQFALTIFFPIFPVARWDSFLHTILPTLSLALVPTISIARIMKIRAIETLNKEFIFYARIRKIPEWRIALFYVLPNSFLPCLHYIGPTVTQLLFGSFAVERVFGIPGLGQWFIGAIMMRDYPVIAGLTAFYSVLLFLVSLIIQLVTKRVDSRLQTQHA